MADFDNQISRSDVAALLPEETATEIISGVETRSAALNMMRRTRMTTEQQKLPVLSVLPEAHFVAAGGGLKKTTKMAWANKYLVAEELAVIVPIPEAYLDDASFDVWGEVRPKIEEAIGIALDAAVFFGINKPSSWGASILAGAVAAGNEIVRGAVGGQDLAGDVSDLMSIVENDGFDVNGFAARRNIRGALRNLRDDNNNPIFSPSLAGKPGGILWGEMLNYVSNRAWVNGSADLFTGDWEQAIIATRQDFTYKILTEATIFDEDGNVVFNFAQQDMVGMRIVARFAYQVANSINGEAGDVLADQFPFGVLRPVGFV